MPNPLKKAVAMYAPIWKYPTVTLEWTVTGTPALDEVDELEDEPAVAVASVVTVPVPAVPASLICAEQVPVAAVVALVVAELEKSQALESLLCSL